MAGGRIGSLYVDATLGGGVAGITYSEMGAQ